MSLEMYKNKMTALEKEHKRKQQEIMLEYAQLNSDTEVGDFFTDHIGAIKVESIKLYADPKGPSLVFFGPEYTKKLKPFKSRSYRDAYQFNSIN